MDVPGGSKQWPIRTQFVSMLPSSHGLRLRINPLPSCAGPTHLSRLLSKFAHRNGAGAERAEMARRAWSRLVNLGADQLQHLHSILVIRLKCEHSPKVRLSFAFAVSLEKENSTHKNGSSIARVSPKELVDELCAKVGDGLNR